jgi:alpha-D-ribose 1-methylphosphonate 5-phosphate C-P lyase
LKIALEDASQKISIRNFTQKVSAKNSTQKVSMGSVTELNQRLSKAATTEKSMVFE